MAPQRISLAQFRSRLRQAENKRKQEINRYNQKVRQKVRAYNQTQKRAVYAYNRAARAYNANLRNLDQQLRKLQTVRITPSMTTVSARRVYSAFSRIEGNRASGVVYPDHLYSLAEEETARSLRVAKAIDGGDVEETVETAALRGTTLRDELEAFSPDLTGRWEGALFSLHPQNPDAARHFCTSVRECFVKALDIAAPDEIVERNLPTCERTDDGRIKRRSKLRYLLVYKNLVDETIEDFVNEDVKDILKLFRLFNDGTHGSAGRFDLNQLFAIKQRAESGIRFLHYLAH